ncbi:hypothetical protein SAMN04488543_3058 [Friedmanniella luteola]|uniref:Uncharacterized protein n=1 Tax=Friedmanniella luteola TaxID=546871 RepID=A0A1H1XPD1_9ACTN|nr:hypothetical protein SAMN04488543_3058 [Friedmanniella luteola]
MQWPSVQRLAPRVPCRTLSLSNHGRTVGVSSEAQSRACLQRSFSLNVQPCWCFLPPSSGTRVPPVPSSARGLRVPRFENPRARARPPCEAPGLAQAQLERDGAPLVAHPEPKPRAGLEVASPDGTKVLSSVVRDLMACAPALGSAKASRDTWGGIRCEVQAGSPPDVGLPAVSGPIHQREGRERAGVSRSRSGAPCASVSDPTYGISCLGTVGICRVEINRCTHSARVIVSVRPEARPHWVVRRAPLIRALIIRVWVVGAQSTTRPASSAPGTGMLTGIANNLPSTPRQPDGLPPRLSGQRRGGRRPPSRLQSRGRHEDGTAVVAISAAEVDAGLSATRDIVALWDHD